MTAIWFVRGRDGSLRGFLVVGHAGSAPRGEDIVCAGVSVLAQATVNALEAVAGIPVAPRIREGFLSVRLPRGLTARQRYDAGILLKAARQGFEDLAAAYPESIRIIRPTQR